MGECLNRSVWDKNKLKSFLTRYRESPTRARGKNGGRGANSIKLCNLTELLNIVTSNGEQKMPSNYLNMQNF